MTSSKIILPLISLFILLTCVPCFASVTVQYNQDGSPHIETGQNPSGDYNDLNSLGEGLTYDIEEEFVSTVYLIDVWHNSSEIAHGLIDSINVTINFTTNVSDDLSLNIYDWSSSEWISSNCDSGSVSADTPTQWWCNITTDAMNYNSSDSRIRFRINSTGDSDACLLMEDYVQYFVGYQSYVEVDMYNPDPDATLNVIQNKTFNVNTTVTCKNGPCGEVFGTIMYNLTSETPDTSVNTTYGDVPFFVNETPANSIKSCGTMISEESCLLNWTINSTGEISSAWEIGTLFNSSYTQLPDNNTDNVTVEINDCPIDISIQWQSINFGLLNPGSTENAATGNSGLEYNVTINSGSCNTDLYINSTNLTNSTLGYEIFVGNVSWNNVSNDYATSHSLSHDVSLIKSNVLENSNVTTWYWIDMPAVYTGYYTGTVSIWGVKNGQSPP